MHRSGVPLEIRTLGSFSISVNGKPVATNWPDEKMKVLFCSLLSPLDLSFSWDRICRSMWDLPATACNKRRLKKVIKPLKEFLTKELGFNPLIAECEGMTIDREVIHLDVLEFYSTVLEGIKQLSYGNKSVALQNFSRANSLYVGDYLPGATGLIITNARHDLEALYQTSLMDAMLLSREN